MANLRVLVAESDPLVRVAAQSALTQQGYFVVPAADGSEALAHMQNNSLDVVVAQVELPKHDALELVRAAQERVHPIPVILLADANSIAAAANGVREGAFDYLVKPLDDLNRLAILIDRAAGKLPPLHREEARVAPPAATLVEAKSTPLLESITNATELNGLLNQFVIELARATRAAHTFVLLSHADGQLHLTASHGFTARTEAGRVYANEIDENFALRVASAKTLRWAGESANSPRQNTLGVPLLFQDQVLGIAIAHETAPPETFTNAMLDSVTALSQQAAIGIELARLAARVKRLEPLDPVTGLITREQFFELADRDFRRAWRFEHTLCAVVMDVDDFGTMHLQLGPQETDQVMRRVAHTVRQHVRRVDLVGRLSPHTLGLVLWMAKKEQGIAVAERLRMLVAEIQVQTEEDVWQVTASFGVAVYRSTVASVFDLFGIADQALRAAKRAGRNRVEGV
ncbi:MAG: diguanylate cyclase [Chloroflexota bacterium]|nr:MAG: diguanylate cyclase [Chloroflexota bacterium]